MTDTSLPHRKLGAAILRTLLYADIFDYPLTASEIQRYLVCYAATVDEVERALQEPWLRERIVQQESFLTIRQREANFSTRLARQEASNLLLAQARRHARWLAAVPYVRMVALTGALAVENPRGPEDDIDYLLAVQPGRVWLARLLVVMLVRLARLSGLTLCPNYITSIDYLALEEHSLFTARELAQMTPLYGAPVYSAMLEANGWARELLPNAFGPRPVQEIALPPGARALKQLGELLLGGRLGDTLERWEMGRKMSRLTAEADAAGSAAACFSVQRCKGHMQDYGARISSAYEARLAAAGLATEEPAQEHALGSTEC